MRGRLVNSNNLCTNPDNHKLHICELTKAGKAEEIIDLQKIPQFICGNCGQKANTPGALCAPGPFQE
ncbi:MAG: hypothetical protein KJ630_03910 [Proteobacteria bacterium]|nr:hypothetical protein [Pseudomonadota bacterium]